MPNPAWDNATNDEKLEQLRADIQKIADAYNRLDRDHIETLRRLNQVESELTKTHPKS
jgi:hypothetical protein